MPCKKSWTNSPEMMCGVWSPKPARQMWLAQNGCSKVKKGWARYNSKKQS